MNQEEAEVIVEAVKEYGPSRVMVEKDYAIPSHKAEKRGIKATVVFIRNDGWTLGAPVHYEKNAFETWSDHWTHFAKLPDGVATPIEEYI